MWWTFKFFGHSQVSYLNGGLSAWEREGFHIEQASEQEPPQPQQPSNYTVSTTHPEYVRSITDVLDTVNLHNQKKDGIRTMLVDARPEGRFLGTVPEPREHLKSGHVPHSVNLPFPLLLSSSSPEGTPDPLTHSLDEDEVRRKVETAIAPLSLSSLSSSSSSLISSCGSGTTACYLVLSLHHLFSLPLSSLPVYDGSWTEYGASDCPIDNPAKEEEEKQEN